MYFFFISLEIATKNELNLISLNYIPVIQRQWKIKVAQRYAYYQSAARRNKFQATILIAGRNN